MCKRTFKNTYIVLFGAFDSDKFVKFSKFETVEDFKKYLDKKCLSYDDGDGIFIHEDDEELNSCFYICEKSYYENTGYVADWYHVEFEDFLNNRGSNITYGEDGESVWYAVGRYDMTEDENLEAIFNDLKAIDGIEIEIDARFISDCDFTETVINSKHFGTYAYGEVFNDWVKECNNNSNLKTEYTQEQKDLLLQIPNKLDDTLHLYVDGVFVDRLDVNQVNQYRINVLKYIYKTGDSSILNRFYFTGHKDTNDMPGEEIKIEMDEKGNLSDHPYELSYVRRHMWQMMKMERKRFGEIK